MHEQLREIGSMRLILRLCPNDLNRADDRALVILGNENDSFAARCARASLLPELPHVCPR
jgi:hypothetical protein